MNTVNPSALLRSLIVYAVCVPLAIFVGYLLTNPLDTQSLFFESAVAAVLVFPLLMKWHYPLLIFCWNLSASLFFLPTHPSPFMFMVAASLGISILERILDRNQPFVPANPVRWPLFAFVVVIYVTAKLTGGIGLRSMGSDVYGGRKYIELFLGIASFFAITARPIPLKQANFYVLLFFSGSFFGFIQDLYAYVPSALRFIFLVFPPSNTSMDEFGNASVTWGETRLAGVSGAGGAFFLWMLAKYGFRGCFLTSKIWRPVVAMATFSCVFLGGFRTSLITVILIIGLLFYLEKIYRTQAMMVVVLGFVLGSALLVPLARHLPYTFQRSMAFLPVDIDPIVRGDAETTTEWRVQIWQALLPQIPEYLLKGKGLAFSKETFTDFMGPNATFKSIDPSENPLALSSDFHNGPLSVVFPFGIWGVLVWLWYWAAGFFVVWRNYRHTIPELRRINTYLYVAFLVKCFMFLFIFGAMVSDVGGFAGIIGLSIALNHGIMRRKTAPQTKPASEPAAARLLRPRPALPSVLGR